MQTQNEDKASSAKITIALAVIIILLIVSAYLIYHTRLQNAHIIEINEEKLQAQKNFNNALLTIDSLTELKNRPQSDRQLDSAQKKQADQRCHIKKDHAARRAKVKARADDKVRAIVAKPPEPVPNAIKIPVFYGTDRKATGSKDPYQYYGGERNVKDTFETGIVEVSIPLSHAIGDLELPSWWHFWGDKRDASKYFVLQGLQALSLSSFCAQLKNAIQNAGEKDLFVFVHGFNNSFEDAAERTAQLAYDLGFKGAPVMYSWPSADKLDGYLGDEENVLWAAPHLKKFLEAIIDRTGAKKINLIGHSMGTRILTTVLSEVSQERKVVFNEVILAAPDIDAGTFRIQIAPKIMSKCSRIILYSSSKDKALIASEKAHMGNVRLGESGAHIFTMQGIETIDASSLSCSDFFDHSYLMESRPLLDDIVKVFNYDAKPEKRNLLAIKDQFGEYWSFKK